ncbi:MAG: hypothetical protein JO252_19135 [Planctomycetaceae bacterium]|nr:hypothetical protein [Planctomycetaceae bacterium]MBV8611467.1 hypothetical protein [Singulisphaera sp.]
MADTMPACVPAHVLDAVRERYLWIFASEAASILGMNRRLFPRVVAAAGIRTRTLPGTRTRYYRPDVEAVARTSVSRPGDLATALTAGPGPCDGAAHQGGPGGLTHPPGRGSVPLRGGERSIDG